MLDIRFITSQIPSGQESNPMVVIGIIDRTFLVHRDNDAVYPLLWDFSVQSLVIHLHQIVYEPLLGLPYLTHYPILPWRLTVL